MAPVATPSVVGLSGGGWQVAPPSITCKREAPRNDGDTGMVSAAGTPMLKYNRTNGVTPRVPDPNQGAVRLLSLAPAGASPVRVVSRTWPRGALVGPGHAPRGDVLGAQSSRGTRITLARRWILIGCPCSPRTPSDPVVGHTLSRYRGSWR
ncbi:hypothetical protein TIFTF001_006592 [Ficus carica]|uniref:Uncharacterized protein n=1 Tax=Ficus carica TaxID=3494 RepID=A0AA87ZHR8_FICCA|nr:hypothetical protein TIFTF001_006592 [Ficus carica]